MTAGFEVDPAALRARSRELADVGARVGETVRAAEVASAPEAFGTLCSALPGLLAPATGAGRDALAEGATTVRALAEALGAAADAYERGDDAAAATFLGGP